MNGSILQNIWIVWNCTWMNLLQIPYLYPWWRLVQVYRSKTHVQDQIFETFETNVVWKGQMHDWCHKCCAPLCPHPLYGDQGFKFCIFTLIKYPPGGLISALISTISHSNKTIRQYKRGKYQHPLEKKMTGQPLLKIFFVWSSAKNDDRWPPVISSPGGWFI